MARLAVFVDAGYFFAAGVSSAYGIIKPQRKCISINSAENLVTEIRTKAQRVANNNDMLRIYWYDGMTGSWPSKEQSDIAMLPGVKLRLGIMNRSKEQKGVDSLIVTDMIDLARNKAIADAVLIAGDEDLRIAVQVAQSLGVRVHVLAVGSPAQNVSRNLQMEADSIDSMDGDWFKSNVRYNDRDASDSVAAGLTGNDARDGGDFHNICTNVIDEIIAKSSKENLAKLREVFKTRSQIPVEIDRALLLGVSDTIKRGLTEDERRGLREAFREAMGIGND